MIKVRKYEHNFKENTKKEEEVNSTTTTPPPDLPDPCVICHRLKYEKIQEKVE
jgi:hypothetical protein